MVIHPRCSMYGIFTYIYPNNHPNVGKYIPYMEYLGSRLRTIQKFRKQVLREIQLRRSIFPYWPFLTLELAKVIFYGSRWDIHDYWGIFVGNWEQVVIFWWFLLHISNKMFRESSCNLGISCQHRPFDTQNANPTNSSCPLVIFHVAIENPKKNLVGGLVAINFIFPRNIGNN